MVIVVEDDKLIGKLITLICRGAGLNCEYHPRWEEARAAIERDPQRYIQAIVDMGLSGRASGLEAVNWLQEHYPHIMCILISGLDLDMSSFVEEPPRRVFIRKPFSRSELVRFLARP